MRTSNAAMFDPLRIVFMGSPVFAVPTLEALAHSRHPVVSVVTGSDKRRGRGGERCPTAVKAAADVLGLPVIQTDSLHAAAIGESLAGLAPDLIVVVAFKILPPGLLAIPRIGSINAHASLLPKYRGAAPIHHAIIHGETETGVTIFMLDRGIDTGGILLREKTPVGPDETTGDVYERLRHMAADAVIRAVDGLAAGTASPVPQDDTLATSAPKIHPDDGWLDLTQTATALRNRIRAFAPQPGAWVRLDGRKLRILAAEADPSPHLAADPFQWQTGSGWLRPTLVHLEGRRIQTAAEFRNGYVGAWRIESKKEYI
jgi:methionyl-tRNA formyltransferase